MISSNLSAYLANKPHREAMYQWAEQAEIQLATSFTGWVNNLDLNALVAEEEVPPLEHYKLVPITAAKPRKTSSTVAAGESFDLPAGVDLAETPHSSPYIDTALAIGLTHRDTLQAVAAAQVFTIGAVVIEQIQAFVGPRNSGLYGGFAWQDPLARGWMAVGQELNAPQVIVTGAKNNRYIHDIGFVLLQKKLQAAGEEVPETRAHLTTAQIHAAADLGAAALAKNYDTVADRLGFTRQSNGDWSLNLSATSHA